MGRIRRRATSSSCQFWKIHATSWLTLRRRTFLRCCPRFSIWSAWSGSTLSSTTPRSDSPAFWERSVTKSIVVLPCVVVTEALKWSLCICQPHYTSCIDSSKHKAMVWSLVPLFFCLSVPFFSNIMHTNGASVRFGLSVWGSTDVLPSDQFAVTKFYDVSFSLKMHIWEVILTFE